jgi:tetratricopeptide (TPR) repeat protein
MNADDLFERGDALSASGARALQAGDVSEGRDRFRRAIEAYEAALEAAPADDDLLALNLKLCIGARRAGLGQTDTALSIYERVRNTLESRPDLMADEEGAELHRTARLNRADALIGQERTDEAREEIEAVREQVPDHPYVEYLLTRLSDPAAG